MCGRRRFRWWVIGPAAAAAVWLAACGGGGGSGTPAGGAPPDTGSRIDPAVRAAADDLTSADPARVGEGVRAMLEILGIGVYTPDGRQVLAGSERSEDDFWLYDFELPALEAMAGGAPAGFEDFAAVVRANGYGGSAEDLRADYERIYAAHPDHPLVQLLAATGVDFADAPRLTPLQQWLLLLDTFVPPNDRAPPARTRAGRTVAAGGSCGGTIAGGNLASFWGLSGLELGTVLAGYQAYLAIHGHLLSQAFRTRLESSADAIHEGHGGPGDTVAFTLTVEADYTPQPAVDVGCGVLVDAGWQPLHGGLAGATVEWEVPGVIGAHAVPLDQDVLTDANGQAALRLQAVEEAAGGKGTLVEEAATVTAWVDVKPALQAAGITTPQLLSFVPARIHGGTAPLIVSWHEERDEESCNAFNLRYEYALVQAAADPEFRQEISIQGTVPVTIDPSDSDLPVTGEAALSVTGGGFIEGSDGYRCSWTYSGTDAIQVTGTVTPDPAGGPPTAHLSVEHSRSVQTTAEGCTAGAAPPALIPDALDVVLRDGETVQSTGFQTEAGTLTVTYTVELACSLDL